MATTKVQIAGEFFATYEDGETPTDVGKITKLTFMPLGSYAGYFGVPAWVEDGNETLDCEETHGPFWTAMREVLGTMPVDWEE